MEKQKRWQFYLIVAVMILTLYNILPTVFYYTKPLHSPIDKNRAEVVAQEIISRVNSLEDDSKAWLKSFSNLLHIKPSSIEINENDPRLIELTFANAKDAALFKRYLPQAGRLIPFIPSQLELSPDVPGTDKLKVTVIRQIGTRLNSQEDAQLFVYSPLKENGQISEFYKSITLDRVQKLIEAFGGDSKTALQVNAAINSSDKRFDDILISLAKDLNDTENTFGKNSLIAKRYLKSFLQTDENNGDSYVQKVNTRFDQLKNKIATERDKLIEEQKKALENNVVFDSSKQQLLNVLNNQYQTLNNAISYLKQNENEIKNISKPLNDEQIRNLVYQNSNDTIQTISLEGRNPFIENIIVDWNSGKITLEFYPDIQELRLSEAKSENVNYLRDRINHLIIDEVARVGRITDENFQQSADSYATQINNLSNTTSILALNLGYLSQKLSNQFVNQLQTGWAPVHPDLQNDVYPIRSFDEYRAANKEDQKLGLVVYAPAMSDQEPIKGFRTGSIYVIAKGIKDVMSKYENQAESQEGKIFQEDFERLQKILQLDGFIGYAGSAYGLPSEFSKDYIFELDDYYANLLQATREDFKVKGNGRYAILDFSDVEQRILTENKIDDRIQEDLLKWREEYNTAQVDMDGTKRFYVPAPTKNPYIQNFLLSFKKYFRGDDRKILKWGLDLSGGKTVRIGLRDQNNRPVTNQDEIRQAVNELYTRINKMGVSERTIRIENNNIILDFPGSQNMSASELVKASAMSFHIVNEKFAPSNKALKEPINQFLQSVWNEAVVTNRKDSESIKEIAWQHFGGDATNELRPKSQAAQILYDNGLRLANPKEEMTSNAFDDTLSTVAIMQGDDFAQWQGQSHPLLFVFNNYALEGSSLTNINVGYDPSRGNTLSFSIKRSYEGAGRTGSPRDDFYAWTSQFAKDRIIGTPKEAYSAGSGWRMAVILNGRIISSPTLEAALRDAATINGRFSQREINQLAADLKAGSLTYTPKILSEENVSPELGQEERLKGMIASAVAIILVVIAMVGYYHFAGIVASCAVLLNILIMWGVLQNIGSALSLPGIAGIVLTIGMAVDANVLVFERVREEFSHSGRIASAIYAGYRKAFSAIIDSNLTTIIAALILIQFDSGPVKGFAVTLIIGIVSSMFTALFMTRYFFAGWVQNPKNKTLTMSQFIGKTHFDFLGQAKKAIMISVIAMVLGMALFVSQGKSMFGMDFTGGYALDLELKEQVEPATSYRTQAAEALLAHGASPNDFQIRELNRPNHLRIQLSNSMEEKGHPFYGLPEKLEDDRLQFSYLSNPRINWLINSLQEQGLQVEPSLLNGLDKHWTVISGQFSDAMRNNAIIGLSIALISILAYITFRFEFKYAIAAVIGLIHDVIITLGVLALFHWLGFPVQIDLQVVGAIMTIIGYSLNDTIIVFDRIREDVRILRKMKYSEVINHALNVTLSRTLMTSGTTLLVLLALVFLGGSSIFAFSLVMTIGVIVGTLSSLFIAAPALLYFHKREERLEQKELNPRKA
ncbi:MAG: preprotein translocase subunit SecD [Chlamydia sp. 32-24]|nr:MAG: preprotein translocase subunit SecD [Chlamydia sp. 32-24]